MNSITAAASSEQAAWRKLAATALAGNSTAKHAAARQHAAARERLADALGLRGANRFEAAKIYKAYCAANVRRQTKRD